LHIGNIAGISYVLASAQRRLGHACNIAISKKSTFEYEKEYPKGIISLENLNRKSLFRFLQGDFRSYSIYHFHSNANFSHSRYLDSLLMKLDKKKVIRHFHGSDVRNKKIPLLKYLVDQTFVSTPDLLEFVPYSVWLPNPIDLEKWSNILHRNKREGDRINILHPTTNRKLKGTNMIIRGVKRLRNEGYKINLILCENVPHHQMYEYYNNSDIIVEQLLIGCYSMTAVEGMASGKPVITYIEKIKPHLPDFCPLVNSNLKNFQETIISLIEDESLRKQLGLKGREYVERIHDSKRIAKILNKFYKNL
jgi:glycosyltransferase involved in cell wall biosynthesis